MTISTERRATPIILGTGANADIPFDFKVFRAEDILLVKSDGLNIESTLVLGNDYSVVLNPNQNEDAGGFVKLKVALATGERAIITTNAPSLQETRLINQGGFYPDVLNNAFDYLTILIQQLETQIKRVVLLPITTKIDKEKFTRNLAFLTEHVNELDALFNILSHIVIVSRINKEVVIVSKIEKDVTAVANNNTNVTKVADNETNINAVQANEKNINTVSLNIACLESICKNMLALLAVCKNETNITKVANNEPNINKVSNNETNINKVAGNETNINSAVRNEKNITSAVRNETNINKVADNETNITKTAKNEQNINKLVANETNINTVASIDSDVTTVATNVADVTNFSDVYLGKRNVKPTTRTDKTPLETGDLYFDTVKKSIFVYDASLKDWILISSIINAILKQFYFVATAGQNVFKGNDDNNKLLEFELDYIEIFLNGVHLNPEDFTLDTTNQSITLKEVASEKDELYVRSFGALSLPSQEIKNILTIKQKILDVSAKLKEIEGIEKKLKEIVEVHGAVKEIGGLAKIQIELKLLHDHINELEVLFNALPQIKTIAADLKNIDTVATKLKTKIDIIVKDKEAIDKVALIDGEIKTIFNNLDAILNKAGAVVNATELMAGIAKIATQAETTAGIIDNKIVTPKKLEAVLSTLEFNIRDELSELKKVGDVYAKEIDKNSNRLVTHRTDIQQNTTDIVSNTASIATIINTIKKEITTGKLAQSFTVPSVLHDKIQLDGEDTAGHYGYAVAMHNDYLAISDPVLQEVVIYQRDKTNSKIFNIEDVHKGKKHGDIFVEDGQVYIKRSDGVHLDVFKYDETQATLTFKKVSSINLTASYGNSLAINDDYLIVGNPHSKTALIYEHSGIQWQLVKQLNGGDSFGSSVAVTDKNIIVAEPTNKKIEIFDLNFNKVKTFTGGASYSKLVDGNNYLTAVAEPDNNILKIYKNLAEIASKTVKADCISLKNYTLLATSKVDKKAYIYSLLMLHGTGWFTTTETKWQGIPDSANGYTGYNIAGGQYQLVRPTGTTDTYTKYKGGAWVKNGSWGGVLWYLGGKIGVMVAGDSQWHLKGSRLTGSGYFGTSSVISSDGSTVVIGANGDNYAEVYEFTGGQWKLKGSRITGSGDFGVSSNISSDGSTVVIGTYAGNYAEVYEFKGGQWKLKGSRLTGTGAFGYSSDISSDGSTVVIGSYENAYAEVYEFKGGQWKLKGSRLTGSGHFGYSSDISNDGSTVVIGTEGGNYAEVYEFTGGQWKLKGSRLTGTGDFGYQCSLSSDGSVVAIGADDGNHVEAYEFTGGQWKLKGKRIQGHGSGGNLGFTASLDGSGNRLMVGDADSAYVEVYDFNGNNWVIVGKEITGDSTRFGYKSHISKDGTTIIVGNPSKHYAEVYSVATDEQLYLDTADGKHYYNTKEVKDETKFDRIMETVAPLATLPDPIPQANRNLRLTKTDIQEQPNKTGAYVSLLGAGTATTAKNIDDTNFTIGNNYGDACAITTDKILITNKTDSKLAIYDHKGTKQKEIQLETGVGSVIDATDTEAVVGSEKANKFEAISLT